MPGFRIEQDGFVITDYNRSKPFASFLPGIAGIWGKPLWVYYVNRAQCVSSLGTNNKDGAIVEFRAANKAYRDTALQGFRTFLKVRAGKGTVYYEPFQTPDLEPSIEQTMTIKPGSVTLSDRHPRLGLACTVDYYTLPHEDTPALARILSITNTGKKPVSLELLDGLPVVQPFGLTDFLLKNLSRLSEGWFSGVQRTPLGVPYYKLAVEPKDSVEVLPVKRANFYLAFTRRRGQARVAETVIEAEDVFGHHHDFSRPVNFFRSEPLQVSRGLTAKNKSAMAMGRATVALKPGETFTFSSLIGNAGDPADLDRFARRVMAADYLEEKALGNADLLKSVTHAIFTQSSSREFDLYLQQSYLDNILRGGMPVSIAAKPKPVTAYVFSRIHGDMEREYNNYEITPTYFSVGSGNYRDVCQNRRCDLFFNPSLDDAAIRTFINLIQLDGFNPLKVKGDRFLVNNPRALEKAGVAEPIRRFVEKSFTIGELFAFIEENKLKIGKDREAFLGLVLGACEKLSESDFGEGYWTDHWFYNTDLVENYRAIYPDRIVDLLFDRSDFVFTESDHVVKPRRLKHVLWHGKCRQFDALEVDERKKARIAGRKVMKNVVRTGQGKGKVLRTSLFVKLACLVANKFATLDPNGCGIEMESGKPDWCDALNGLPGIFGSSTNESFELKRLIAFLLDVITEHHVSEKREVELPRELADFLRALHREAVRRQDRFSFWDRTHTLLEIYREKTRHGVDGALSRITVREFVTILADMLKVVNRGLERARDPQTGLVASYFINEVSRHRTLQEKSSKGYPLVKVEAFRQKPLPLYLEGIVHDLKTSGDAHKARAVHRAVRRSGLYDRKLGMYKINESIAETTVEIGRAKIFTPGWLENESIWLHMEYKYLLELLKAGLGAEFYGECKSCLIPFLDPGVYGRSTLENSSFLVSSAHPDPNLWGQGFVSRLSGATAEVVNMWAVMTAGNRPFGVDPHGALTLSLAPMLPGWLFAKNEARARLHLPDGKTLDVVTPRNGFTFVFLGRTLITYRNPKRRDTFGPKRVRPVAYTVWTHENVRLEIAGDTLPSPISDQVRNGLIRHIEVDLR